MERCPNCGASTRPGAKFCTTCGFRLADAAPAIDPTNAAADAPASVEAPGAGGAADAATGWPAPPADAAPAAETASAAPGSALEGTPDDAQDPTSDAAASAEMAADVDDRVLDSSWPAAIPSAWSTGWEAAPPSSAEPPLVGPEAAADADPPPGWTTAAFGPPPEPGTEQGLQPTAVDAVPEPIGAPIVAVPEEPPSFASEAGAIPVTAERARTTDATTRAIALVDELRALLPELAAPAPIADFSPVAADLEAFLASDGGASEDRSALRAALLAARDRPRDIDTVLDLSGRVDAMLSLLDAQDRALAAIDRALAALRTGLAGAPPDDATAGSAKESSAPDDGGNP